MNPWRYGKAWRDGKLYVFEPRSAHVMRLWPANLDPLWSDAAGKIPHNAAITSPDR